MKKTYNVKLSEEETYTSPALVKKLTRIARNFFGIRDTEVFISPRFSTAGTNGKSIWLNPDTHLVKEFATRELRFAAFMGMFYHEISHILFHDFDKKAEYMEQLRNGKLPAHEPVPKSEEEQASLDELKKAANEKEYKKLLAETYLAIDNCLSDNHDETAIISRYGNAIKAPIYLIRSSLFRGTPFADELEDEEPLDKMLCLIFSYARFGKIHGNDEALRNDEDIAKLLPKRAMIRQGASTDSPYLRFSIINSLVLLLWPYIKDKAEKEAQEQTGQSWDELSDSEKESIIEQIANAIGEISRQCGGSEAPQGNTSAAAKKITAAADSKAVQELSASLTSQSSPAGQEDAQQPIVEKDSEADEGSAVEATSNVLNAVTQEETERKGQTLAEEYQVQQLGNEAKEVLVASDQHKNISVLYNRNIAVSDSERAEYERVMDSETKKTVRKLIKSVEAVIRSVAEEDERRNLPYGELIYAEEAYRRDKKFFGDRRLPGDTPDIALSILVDESGSMNWSGKRDAACKAAAMLYEFATGLHFPVCVSGHTTGWANEVKYDLFADFDNISNLDRYRLMKITADDCNRDGCAIEIAAAHLHARPEKIKMLIVVSDGLPNDPDASSVNGERYVDDVARNDVRNIVHRWRKKGLEIVAFAIDCGEAGKNAFDFMYGAENVVDIQNIATLPKRMTRIFKKRVEREL